MAKISVKTESGGLVVVDLMHRESKKNPGTYWDAVVFSVGDYRTDMLFLKPIEAREIRDLLGIEGN